MRKNTGLSFALIPVCVLALAACGGGGGGEGGSSFTVADVSGPSAIMATGGSPPDVSSAQVKSMVSEIHHQADTQHLSTSVTVDDDGYVDREEGGKRYYSCFSNLCDFPRTVFTPIMTRNGVRLAKSTEKTTYDDGGVWNELEYGGWMDHSHFFVYVRTWTYDGGSYLYEATGYGRAVGNAPGTNPDAGTFSWNGVMVGRNSDLGSAAVSNVIQGDATVTAEVSQAGDMSVDVAFTNIKDLNAGGSIADMTWTDLAVLDGSFDGGSIHGSFYGPQHQEVAGAYETDYFLGAFGARR